MTSFLLLALIGLCLGGGDYFSSLSQPITDLFGHHYGAREGHRSWSDSMSAALHKFEPRCDVFESPAEVFIQVELPGVRRENIKLETENDILTISGSKDRTEEFKALKHRRAERYYGEFELRMRIPSGTDSNSFKTTLSNGVLEMRMTKPKGSTMEKPMQIPIS